MLFLNKKEGRMVIAHKVNYLDPFDMKYLNYLISQNLLKARSWKRWKEIFRGNFVFVARNWRGIIVGFSVFCEIENSDILGRKEFKRKEFFICPDLKKADRIKVAMALNRCSSNFLNSI